MLRRRTKYDIYVFVSILILAIGYLMYDSISSESRGTKLYADALNSYKNTDYEIAYQKFSKIPSNSSLKICAVFRQARCATNLGRNNIAIKKYNKILHYRTRSSIVPISEYNMAILMQSTNDPRAKKHFKKIIKKHPTSDYAIASEYYLGLIDLDNMPKSEKAQRKTKERALIHFKTYIEKSPDGRFSLDSANEINKLKVKTTNYDNLLLAKVYYMNGDYETAKQYLNKTTLNESWAEFVKNEYRLGNTDKVRYYTEFGLKDHSETVSLKDAYEVVDTYIQTFPTRREGINTLISKNYSNNGADYIKYLQCSETMKGKEQEGCFKALYEKYPNGEFSAEALYNIFIAKYLQKKYNDAQRLGFLHLKKFQDVKSSPAVTYYMGKISTKSKHYENASVYYKKVLDKYPDSYYAYRANYNLHKDDGAFSFYDITPKPIVFPYKKSSDDNLVIKLALLKDYDLVEEMCKKDKFIQSWIAYQKEKYTISALLARNAMEELSEKPPYTDLRWRLIYPLHYYNTVDKVKGNNNPIILQSIIKEESHFNSYIGSQAGAKGLMQLMPATFDEIANSKGLPKDILSPEINIQAGSIYYEKLKKVLGNKDLYAISAYNGGIGSVTSWFSNITYNDADEFIEQIPYPETKNYVKKVLRTYWMYSNIY